MKRRGWILLFSAVLLAGQVGAVASWRCEATGARHAAGCCCAAAEPTAPTPAETPPPGCHRPADDATPRHCPGSAPTAEPGSCCAPSRDGAEGQVADRAGKKDHDAAPALVAKFLPGAGAALAPTSARAELRGPGRPAGACGRDPARIPLEILDCAFLC